MIRVYELWMNVYNTEFANVSNVLLLSFSISIIYYVIHEHEGLNTFLYCTQLVELLITRVLTTFCPYLNQPIRLPTWWSIIIALISGPLLSSYGTEFTNVCYLCILKMDLTIIDLQVWTTSWVIKYVLRLAICC